MTEFTIRIDVPAIDNLAATLIKLFGEPVLTADPAPAEPAAKQAEEFKTMAEEIIKPAPAAPALTPAPVEEPKPTPAPTTAFTLDQVQRAAAQLRDLGKLKMVTDMFPEFGIRKLSDLADDKLQSFAARLQGLGASL